MTKRLLEQAAALQKGAGRDKPELLRPAEVDKIFRYPRNRSEHLARSGVMPYVKLPDGAIRFYRTDIETITRMRIPATRTR